jgi:hypothetical protein
MQFQIPSSQSLQKRNEQGYFDFRICWKRVNFQEEFWQKMMEN